MSLTNTVPATDKPFKHTAISAFAALSAMTVFTTTLLTALPSACAADVVRPQAAPVRLTEPSAAKPAANPAFQRAPAAVPGKFVRRSTEADLLRFPISAQHASRIAFTGGERIESAIWDQQDLDLKTDTAACQIFVRPKREGEIMLYVTTESGETAAIVLDAGLERSPQNILLERADATRASKLSTEAAPSTGTSADSPDALEGMPMTGGDPRPASMLAPSPAPEFVSSVKRFVRHATLREEAPDIMKRSACPKPTRSLSAALVKLERLKPVVASCWTTRDLTAVVLRLKNDSPVPVLIREPALTGPSVAAITTDKAMLRYGDSAELIFVEVARHD